MLDGKAQLNPDQQLLDAMSRYRCNPEPIGEGGAGIVLLGIVPTDFCEFVAPVDRTWIPGITRVAVKVPKDGDVVDINQMSIQHEVEISDRLASIDYDGIFIRYCRDIEHNLLLSEYQEKSIALDRWVRMRPGGPEKSSVKHVASQLRSGLTILRAANIVHSDLCWQNVLIDPTTEKILIIDFGIAAFQGLYTPGRERLDAYRRAGRLKSPNQRSNLPAEFGDDEYSVRRMVANLQRKTYK